ncbi:DNA adenine methylase [Paenibacillus tyrfis]|uniref:DNA adenine methylase n=1 Tax=Paenibacillus tyrfis TaxID=1501230 RepID=UPI000B58A081|nr:DNA adenine methylase [Paenibacillus tyrfis]
MYLCRFCGNDEPEEEAEYDPTNTGFWCSCCDGYTYLDPATAKEHRFTLILEDGQGKGAPQPTINVHLNKRASPLRYPGGKSKVIPYINSLLQPGATRTFVGAYAGGASVELALLMADIVDELVLNDLDFGIYALFWTIKHAPYELIDRINSEIPTHADFFACQTILKSDYASCTIFEAAWAQLLVNRLAYSGIYKANPLGGRNGSKRELLSRWNPDELCKRIRLIHSVSDRITLFNMDACKLIEEYYWQSQTTIYIDPPYVQKGKQLYRCYYNREEHMELSMLLDSLYHGMPGADLILIYDNSPFIEEIYMYPSIEKFSRVYSV